MKVKTTRFGEIDFAEDKLLHMPRGLLGFQQYKSYVILDHDDTGRIKWLQCVDAPDLAFVIADPIAFFNDYNFMLKEEFLSIIDIKKGDEIVTVVVMTIHDGGQRITVNLQAPIVINSRVRKGMQIICDEPDLSSQHQVYPPVTATP